MNYDLMHEYSLSIIKSNNHLYTRILYPSSSNQTHFKLKLNPTLNLNMIVIYILERTVKEKGINQFISYV